ncbi:NADP-dependent oxidoreductase [soil metagenome]
MSRAVRFDRVGPASVLYLADVEPAVPGPGKIRVRVKAAGLNPADYKVRNGTNPPTVFPASLGRELAGVVESLGEGVTRVAVGDEVFGNVAEVALAELAVTNPNNMAFKPAALSWEIAGGLALAGQTAWDELASQNVTDADTVLVSAAAGGVGGIVSQLALRTGATVIGTASEENHEFLRSRGIIPVAYGPGLADRVRRAAPTPITVVFDHHGSETILAALELGVSPQRINTIAMNPDEHGVQRVGRGPINTDTLDTLAALVVEGALVVEIAATYPLEKVVEAYEQLEGGHVRGKIVVLP